MDQSARNDLIAAILVLGVAAVFGYATKDIYVSPFDPGFSARDFPIIVISLLVIFTVIMMFPALKRLARTGWRIYEAGESQSLRSYVLPMVAAAFLYVWLNQMFQYFGPTILAAIVSLAMFGNRTWARLTVVPVIGAVVYYVLFFGIMGLHETPGTVWEFNSQVIFRPLRDFLGLF